MAQETYISPVSPEEYDRGKAGCVELSDLEPDSLYTYRTVEQKYLDQVGLIGSSAVDLTTRVIGVSASELTTEVALESFNPLSGRSLPVDSNSADRAGLTYQDATDELFGADIGYFLQADETLGVENGRIVVYVPVPLIQREAVELKS